ncbi:MAG: TIGR02996 domain-containing protein, partial [Fimbriiglobus sp.]
MSTDFRDRHALVAGVAARPADDVPRLAFADWFDENGQPGRAAFIRAECAATRFRPGSASRASELDRADDLRSAHVREWLGPWADRLIDWEFSRGFVASVRLTATAFLAHGEDLFRTEPVRRVELVSDSGGGLDPDAIRAVVAHPAFAHVRDCAIVPSGPLQFTPVGVWMAAIAGNPHVAKLERFGPTGAFAYRGRPDGRSDGLDEESFAAFCWSKHLVGLRSLTLRVLSYEYEARDPRPWLVEHLARAPFAPNLRRLTLTRVDLPVESFRRIAADPVFGNLRALDLSGNPGAADGMPLVFASRTLTRLRTLAVLADRLPDYAASPVARQVRNLTVDCADDLNRNLATERRAWLELIRTAPPPRRLTMNCHNPGRDVFVAMRRAKWLRDVRKLSISGDSQYEVYSGRTGGLQALFSGNAMPRLTRLRLHEAAGAKLRERLRRWPGLT